MKSLIRPDRSLGLRLSLWLALLSLVSLASVLGGVFACTAWSLEQRQEAALQQKRLMVERLLAGAAQEGSLLTLRQSLDELLAGSSLGLRLSAPDGQVLYARAPLEAPRHVRQSAFELRSPLVPAGPLHGQVAMDVSADQHLLQWMGSIMLASAIVGSVLVSLSAAWLVRRGLKPVRALSRQIRALRPNNLESRLDSQGQPLELQPVVQHFNELLGRLEQSYSQLEAFNANVAHELRTPLAVLIGHSEVALSRPRPVHELRDVIGANLEDLQRLSAMVNDMLFLSRADRGVQARRAVVPSIAAVAGEVVEFHEAALHEAGLRVQVCGDASGTFDVGLLRRALSNLLSNATRYAQPRSDIEIEIVTPSTNVLQLAVINSGPTIDPSHLPRLFERFYRADAAREGSDHHHGLGLAIVEAIARMHGGDVFARSQAGRTCIGMRLPVSEPAAPRRVAADPTARADVAATA